ncbi:spore coat protein [Limnochorda pilosa]|uniref:Coat protein F n=1 Tax=Limnochorda pilosa TaxID=1555112 RepID=A0A0K2SL93_LIMPI|nr:spore coat protein [Limnochorda pilosa]BAS27891.1 coat protein F [Limnochorda pilosa]
MLQDKEMAADIQDMLKHQTVAFTRAAIESSDPNIRQAFVQMRSAKERAHWEMYQLNEQKGWYLPAGPADHAEVNRVKGFFQSALDQTAQPALR